MELLGMAPRNTLEDSNLNRMMLSSSKRRRRRTVSSAMFLLSLTACTWQGEAFGLPKFARRAISFRTTGPERFAADENNNNNNGVDSSWSKSATGRRSSPLQVRKRVRAVLEKARTRTGVDNSSTSRPSNVVAEAASLGGLNDDFVINIKGPDLNGTRRFADEDLEVVQKSNGESTRVRKPEDFDVIRGDSPAATASYDPFPFELPKLSGEQIRNLQAGGRVQEQSRMGREGSGYVVLDVQAPPYVVWECLLDFESYPETIPTVRNMQLYTSEKLNTGFVNEIPVLPGTGREARHYGAPSITRAAFTLSKFRLNIAAVHQYTPHPKGDYMVFTLDKSCTNMVLKGAKGIWHTKEDPDGREVRTYFCYRIDMPLLYAIA
jgi:hypothetical protein